VSELKKIKAILEMIGADDDELDRGLVRLALVKINKIIEKQGKVFKPYDSKKA